MLRQISRTRPHSGAPPITPWDKMQRLGEATHPGPKSAAEHKAARPPKGAKHLDICVQNISYFGNVSKKILTNLSNKVPEAAQCDVFCFQETHTPPKSVGTDQSWLDRNMATCSSWSPARAGGDSQDRHSVGGTLIACKRYLHHTLDDPGAQPSQHTTRLDWSPAIITGRLVQFVVISIYLRPNELSDHAITMRQIKEYLRECSLPFIISGDFNASQQALADSGLLDGLHYHIVLPQGVAQTAAQQQTTCHSAKSATLIDYCVIDHRIASLCKCTAITTPWKTHMGLIVHIYATIDKLMARIILGPKPFPFEADTRIEGAPLKTYYT